MRNTFKYIITIAASLLVGVSAFAQTQKTAAEAIKVDKTSKPNGDGTYTLSMEAFLTGYSNSSVTHVTKPLDIVLILDKSASMGANLGGYKYTANASRDWSYDTYTSSRYYLDDVTLDYYLVTRERTSSNTDCRLFVTIGGQKKYLTSNGLSDDYERGKRNNNTIWSGVLYTRSSNASRMDALVGACRTFVTAIKKNAAETGADHKIAIINFAGPDYNNSTTNRNKYDRQLTNQYDALLSYINGSDFDDTWTGTYPSGSFSMAKNWLDAVPSDRKSAKLVVMFTDGKPGTASDFVTAFTEERDQISEANATIAAAKVLKEAGIPVYTVGTFNDSAHENVIRYMNYVSSNYPDATGFDTSSSGDPVDADKRNYTTNATSASELSSVFQNIAGIELGNVGNGQDIILDVNQVSVNDVVTPQFALPGGAESITVKVVNALNATKVTYSDGSFVDENDLVWYTDDGYTWDDAHAVENPEGVSVELVGNPGEEKTVTITGFDFSSNWVGLTEEYVDGERTEWAPHGAKLVISFVVAPDPFSEGGAASTNNKATSGVYVGTNNPTIVNFPEQETRFTPMNLTISAEGLTEGLGESVIFNITSTDGLNMFVAFTEGEVSSQTIAQLPVVKADGTTKIEYTVTPVTSWGWTYTHPEAESAKTLDQKHEYSFTVNPVTKTIKHAENAKNNKFE